MDVTDILYKDKFISKHAQKIHALRSSTNNVVKGADPKWCISIAREMYEELKKEGLPIDVQ